MATSTLIQYLEREGFSSLPGGAAEAVGAAVSHRRQTETFKVASPSGPSATNSVAVGDVVQFALVSGGGSTVAIDVLQAPADSHCVGVALEAASTSTNAAGDTLARGTVECVIGGLAEAKVEGANNAGNTAIVAGDFLCLGDTAGTLYKYTAGTDAMPHAIAVDAVGSGASGVFTVMFLKQF
jgi:hypothetical protein